MSVLYAKEIYDGRDFESTEDERRYTRVWRVRTNSRYDEGVLIQNASRAFGFPVYGDTHHRDPLAKTVSVRGVQSAGPYLWILSAEYSTKDDPAADPIDDTVQVEWDDEFHSEETILDADGKAMASSAGDAFDTPYQVDVGLKTISLRFNIAAPPDGTPPDWAFDLPSDPTYGRYTLNDKAVRIDEKVLATRRVRFERARLGKVELRNGIYFRRCECKLSWKPSGWNIQRLNEGFRRIVNPESEESQPRSSIFNDGDGGLPQRPVILRNDPIGPNRGQPLLDPTPQRIADFGTINFPVYTQANFTVVPGIRPE